MQYEVIEAKAWMHKGTGRTVSAYGAKPHGPDWALTSVGWTVRNPHTSEVGACRKPWDTREEAEAWASSHTPSRHLMHD